jgi:hypothetical protein
VNLSAALAADLAALSDALDDGTELGSLLATLADTVTAAVGSYLGMTMTLVAGAHEVSFTVREEPDGRQIGTSLRIPLGSDASSNAGSALTLYAAAPGAFVDLAADLSYALSVDVSELHLDGQLTAPDGTAGIDGLAVHSAVNQAVGVLLDGGHTPESADEELRRLADVHGVTLALAAVLVLETIAGRPRPDADPAGS